MGWTVLYIAFGIVALWLLGEVLLQYKARLRWRLLAFVGFLTVVVGVLMPSVPVIGAGAIAFAVGQTYVTLSFRSGFSSGWAMSNAPAWAVRRRDDEAEHDEAYDGYDDREGYDGYAAYEDHEPAPGRPEPAPGTAPAAPADAPGEAVYTPQPMPDETGQYGVYDDSARQAAEQGAYAGHDGYPGYTGYGQGSLDPYGQDVHAAAHETYGEPYAGGQGNPGDQGIYAGPQQTYAEAGFDYNSGQYAGYPDPYGQQQYDPYSGYGQGYDAGGYAADPYQAQQYGTETPPGGVWVPQQRDGEPQYQQSEEQPYPYQGGYQNYEAHEPGYDGQYRY